MTDKTLHQKSKIQTDESNRLHLVCSKCSILLDCDWMGISIDYDDDCLEGEKHIQKEVECDCEQLVEYHMQNISTKGEERVT